MLDGASQAEVVHAPQPVCGGEYGQPQHKRLQWWYEEVQGTSRSAGVQELGETFRLPRAVPGREAIGGDLHCSLALV
jgi:hypothetical protein